MTAESNLTAAADGLCVAIAMLPDTVLAERTFVNQAHDALHALAAQPRLDRTLSAPILEAMDRVEQDFNTAAPARVLAPDLSALRIAAIDALGALAIDIPACGS